MDFQVVGTINQLFMRGLYRVAFDRVVLFGNVAFSIAVA